MATYFPDIPLKPPQETFFDDPVTLDDVSLDELVFDLTHGLKEASKLHLYHAVFVLQQTVEHIVRLRSQPKLFAQFRREQLAKYSIADEMETAVATSDSEDTEMIDVSASAPLTHVESVDSVSTENSSDGSSPLVIPETSLNGHAGEYREATPDSLSDSDETAAFIPIEDLLATSSFDVVLIKQTNVFRVDLCQAPKQNSHLLKAFNLLKAPKLSVAQFLQRIKTYSPAISISVYVHASLMMFKLCILLDVVPLTPHNVHRFILSSVRCCTKNLDDVYQKQRSFATVVGVSQRDLYKLEVGFLYLCNFKLIVDENMMNLFLKGLFVDLVGFCEEHGMGIEKKSLVENGVSE